MMLFKKKVYEEWEIKGKLAHLKIIHIRCFFNCLKIIYIRCFVLSERVLVLKMSFLATVRKLKQKKKHIF